MQLHQLTNLFLPYPEPDRGTDYREYDAPAKKSSSPLAIAAKHVIPAPALLLLLVFETQGGNGALLSVSGRGSVWREVAGTQRAERAIAVILVDSRVCRTTGSNG